MLAKLQVLVVDCQASGATPRQGALLEVGWAMTGPQELTLPVEASWVTPPPGTSVSRPVRQLTGWNEGCLEHAVAPGELWLRLLRQVAASGCAPQPCVIHFARFELGFLQDLHRRYGQGPFPLDTVCLHEIARRLFPSLPRRNLRALAGYLGHSPTLVRRSAGHVEASAFIWRAVVPALEAAGIQSWEALKTWLEEKAPPRPKRTYPMPAERRRALPGRPGVYRFLRSNGDVLYVGKAANLKKRVLSHFTRGGRSTERALEMLTQVHDVDVTPVETALEAALLETDEIKRLAPPYNVHLLEGGRRAWFATADLKEAAPAPDAVFRVGPLPSSRALAPLAALRALAEGADCCERGLRAAAVGVPRAFAPEEMVFAPAWENFHRTHLAGGPNGGWLALLRAAKRLALTGVADDREDRNEEVAPDEWNLDRVRRHLDRALLRSGQLFRRARCLVLLADAGVAFQERGNPRVRLLLLERAEIVERRDIEDPQSIPRRAPLGPWRERQAVFDAARYDRLRVLATELCRVRVEGGRVLLRIGARLLDQRGARLLIEQPPHEAVGPLAPAPGGRG